MAATNQREQQNAQVSGCVGWIDAEDMQVLQGHMVSIVGRNMSQHADEAAEFTFVDGNGTQFKVLVPKSDFQGYVQGTVVEISGRVLTSQTILQISYKDWGMQANLKLWSALLKLTQQFPALFWLPLRIVLIGCRQIFK